MRWHTCASRRDQPGSQKVSDDPCGFIRPGAKVLNVGVAIEHAGVVAMQGNLNARMHAGPGRRMMQFLAAGFDGSMLEIFSAILNGATLVLRPDKQDALAALRAVDIAILTPSAVEGLDPVDFPNLKYVRCIPNSCEFIVYHHKDC